MVDSADELGSLGARVKKSQGHMPARLTHLPLQTVIASGDHCRMLTRTTGQLKNFFQQGLDPSHEYSATNTPPGIQADLYRSLALTGPRQAGSVGVDERVHDRLHDADHEGSKESRPEKAVRSQPEVESVRIRQPNGQGEHEGVYH
jgi:hypothetical protein